jgi:hypothetical protein
LSILFEVAHALTMERRCFVFPPHHARRRVTHGIMWLEGALRKKQRGNKVSEAEDDDDDAHPGDWRALYCLECTKSQKREGAVIVKDGGDLDVVVRDDEPLDFIRLSGRCSSCYKRADYQYPRRVPSSSRQPSGGKTGKATRQTDGQDDMSEAAHRQQQQEEEEEEEVANNILGACAAHKTDGMVYARVGKRISINRCRHPEGCERQATFGRPALLASFSSSWTTNGVRRGQGKAVRCSLHRRSGDCDVRNRLCRHSGCSSRPSYGAKPQEGDGGKGVAVYCAKHRLKGHVDLKNRLRCNYVSV